MVFEDLQKAFVEADLAKLREKGVKLKPKKKGKGEPQADKVASNDKKKKVAGKKLALTKGLKKTKDKAKVKTPEEKKIEKEKVAAEAEEKEKAQKAKDKGGKEQDSADLPPPDQPRNGAQVDMSLYQQKFYLPEDKEKVSGLDQLEVINKLPAPEDKPVPPPDKEKVPQDKAQDKVLSAKERFQLLRDALGGGNLSADSLSPSKTPITEAAKAAKQVADKSAGSMNDILKMHEHK